MGSETISLEYEGDRGVGRRRRRRRWAAIWVVVGLGIAVLAWRADFKRRYKAYREWRWREGVVREMENDAPGPEVVAYEDDPVRAAPLVWTRDYSTFSRVQDGRNVVGRSSLAWSNVRQFWGWWPVTQGDPILFMHERRTAGGRRRVVVVHAAHRLPGPSTWVDVSALTFATGASSSPPGPARREFPRISHIAEVRRTTGNGLRIWAGQADAGDESHFTIAYEIHGVPGVLEGWLKDAADGDVSVELRGR
jgi:hypothetical protein